jgi:pantoate--beta-alanine ligase
MKTVNEISQVRQYTAKARRTGKRIGFVPTMGALHEGHLSLIECAIKESDYVVVSIFVNPAQFGPDEDLEKYPRNIDKDIELCKEKGVDLVFAPTAEIMYPRENLTWVNVDKITDGLCGKFRKGHFRGVATVCTKLFNIVGPDVVFFGQKDAQQALVVKTMTADLNMDIEVRVCPIARDSDGMALSSRNKYLGQEQRSSALLLSKAMRECEKMVAEGLCETRVLKEHMMKVMAESSELKVEYLEIVDSGTLEPVETVSGSSMAVAAVYVGQTRLIDNAILNVDKGD